MPESLFLEIIAPTGTNAKSPTAELPRQGKLIVGASSDRASFVVEGQGVADVHCAIGRLKGGGWALKDLGSEFGTRVNGKRVDSARLGAGDEILIGSRKLRVFDPSAESPAAADGAKGVPAAAPSPKPAARSKPKSPAKPAAKRKDAPGGVPAKKPKTVELAGYRIERPLGRGAMGDVYLATQTSLDRKVALKMLKSELAKDATFVQRFRDEARAAARLNHPNVVTVFDVGEEQGRHYLSMEYMDGESLEARLSSGGPMPWREALDVVRDAAAGLVYAEANGIVHRDIKPENLMRNGDGVTKIADLGLAVQVEQESVDDGAGKKVFGTPHFIAPEVVRGEKADARSDMFSLGATAYRILSGRTPFDGASTREILRALLNDEPAALGSLVPGLPAGFEAVIHRLLAKSPEDRYASASILLRDVEQLRQTGGREASVAAASGAGGSGGPNLTLIGGGVAVLAIAGLAFAMLGGGGDEPDPGPGFDRFPSREDGAVAKANPDASSGTAPGPSSNDPAGDDQDSGTDNDNDPAGVDPGDAGVSPAGSGAPEGPTTADEADFEYRAQLAYLELGDEALSSADRAARLRALSEAFAGTDIASKALEEANTLEAGVIETERNAQALVTERTQTLDALRGAADLDAKPFHPGTSLRAMRLIPVSEGLLADRQFQEARRAVVDEVLKKGLQHGRDAIAAADAAEKEGDFERTTGALRGFIGMTDLPSAEEAPLLVGEGAPPTLAEFRSMASAVRTRLESLAGREEEFQADRIRRERVDVGRALGPRLETSLRSFDLARAAESIDQAAALVSDDGLTKRMRASGADLRAAAPLFPMLLDAWGSPGWRRRGIADPRPEGDGSVNVVGVAKDAILIEGSGAPIEIPTATWNNRTAALQNLFRGRLDRDYSAEEMRGITTLLTVTATLETLDNLGPALMASGRRVEGDAAQRIESAFSEAREWAADNDDLLALVNRHAGAAEKLSAAILARENGEWATSAEMLRRLIEEQRDTWIVMILSDGGKR